MSKAILVVQGEYDDFGVLAIFTEDLEKQAIEFAQRLQDQKPAHEYDIRLEYEILNPSPQCQSWVVCLDKGGKIQHTEVLSAPILPYHEIFSNIDGEVLLRAYVTALNVEQALFDAQELLRRVLDEDKWVRGTFFDVPPELEKR